MATPAGASALSYGRFECNQYLFGGKPLEESDAMKWAKIDLGKLPGTGKSITDITAQIIREENKTKNSWTFIVFDKGFYVVAAAAAVLGAVLLGQVGAALIQQRARQFIAKEGHILFQKGAALLGMVIFFHTQKVLQKIQLKQHRENMLRTTMRDVCKVVAEWWREYQPEYKQGHLNNLRALKATAESFSEDLLSGDPQKVGDLLITAEILAKVRSEADPIADSKLSEQEAEEAFKALRAERKKRIQELTNPDNPAPRDALLQKFGAIKDQVDKALKHVKWGNERIFSGLDPEQKALIEQMRIYAPLN